MLLTTFTTDLLEAPIWCSFGIIDKRTGTPFFSGFCDAAATVTGQLWNVHPGFRRYVGTVPPENFTLAVKFFSQGREAFLDATQNKLEFGIPDDMFIAGAAPSNRSAVKCVETGAVFSNASAAARAAGVHAAQMSFHLNGNPSYPRIKGQTYVRI